MSEEEVLKRQISNENLRLFYQIQYDRIDKLETKRENFCNYVITISSLLLVLLCNDFQKISKINQNLLFGFICLLNLIVIKFISKTRPFVKMHQERADKASEIFAPEFNKIKDSVEKPPSDRDFFRRSRLYSYVHLIIILFAILMIIKENKWLCE